MDSNQADFLLLLFSATRHERYTTATEMLLYLQTPQSYVTEVNWSDKTQFNWATRLAFPN